jgi:hypothetical protein
LSRQIISGSVNVGSKFVAKIFNNISMHPYQQLDLQALIDMLATETQEYTRAFTRGAQEEIAIRKIVIDALIAEIKRRKKENVLPQNVLTVLNPPDQTDTD